MSEEPINDDPGEGDPAEDWDFYMMTVDGKPASIFVDLAAADDAPVDGFAHMVFLKVFMREPRPDGLSSTEEFEALSRIDHAVDAAVRAHHLRYVGRQTTDGFRDFVCYATSPTLAERALARVMADFPEYRFETGSRPDDDWDIYFEYLYPSDRIRQVMLNRRLYDNLESLGDPLVDAREVRHWAYFPTAYERSIFMDECKARGFEPQSTSEPDAVNPDYGVIVTRRDIPAGDTFDDDVMALFDLTAECGGDYDGWETEVLAEKKPAAGLLGKFFGKKKSS